LAEERERGEDGFMIDEIDPDEDYSDVVTTLWAEAKADVPWCGTVYGRTPGVTLNMISVSPIASRRSSEHGSQDLARSWPPCPVDRRQEERGKCHGNHRSGLLNR
jgi:hypothetical protein